jgi:FtsH-binding integral membrane protein
MSFIGITYLHLTGALGLTAVSSEYPISSLPSMKIVDIILSFVLIFAISFTPFGPLKYLFFILFCLVIGQLLSPRVKDLQSKGALREILASVAGIFLAMTLVGFIDNQNILGFGGYLFAALLGLIVARLILIFTSLGNPQDFTKINTLLNWFSTILFAIFVAYDTQRLKAKKPKMDYIDASLALFLDIINLFNSEAD